MAGTPHPVSGNIFDTDGTTPINNVRVSILNAVTNEAKAVLTNQSGEYLVDLANYPSGFTDGDDISIYASYGRNFKESVQIVNINTGYTEADLTIDETLPTAVRYCTATQVRSFTQTQNTEYSDTAVNDIIGRATNLIDSRTGRTWKGLQVVTDELHDGDDGVLLWLNKTEVQSITALSIDDDDDGTYTTITVDDYVKHKTGESFFTLDTEAEVTRFAAGINTIKVSYTHGNTTPSERVRRLCLLIVQNEINYDQQRENQIQNEITRLKYKGPLGMI